MRVGTGREGVGGGGEAVITMKRVWECQHMNASSAAPRFIFVLRTHTVPSRTHGTLYWLYPSALPLTLSPYRDENVDEGDGIPGHSFQQKIHHVLVCFPRSATVPTGLPPGVIAPPRPPYPAF